MTGKKVQDLIQITLTSGNFLIPISDDPTGNGSLKSISITNLSTAVGGGGGGGGGSVISVAGRTGVITLSKADISGLGTASTLNSGNFLQSTNNLLDLLNISSARTNLGLGTSAILNSGNFFQISNNLSDGNATTIKTNLGLNNVTTQGNTFNSNLQLVQLTAAGKYPALDGSLITGISGGGGGGTVSGISIITANGFSGNINNPTTTPNITLSTTINGILKGNSTAISAATANIDYVPVNNPIFTGQAQFNVFGYSSIYANGISGSGGVINWGSGNIQSIILNTNTPSGIYTPTFISPSKPGPIVLYVTQGNSGNCSFSWPNTVKSPGGVKPTVTLSSGAIDIIAGQFDGTYYYLVNSVPNAF